MFAVAPWAAVGAASPAPWARDYRRRRARDRRRRLADRARALAVRRSVLYGLTGWNARSDRQRYLLDFRRDYPPDSPHVYLRDYPPDSPRDYPSAHLARAGDLEPLPGARAGAWLAAAALVALALAFVRVARRRATFRAAMRRRSGEWAAPRGEPPPAYSDVCAESPDKGAGPAPSAVPPAGAELPVGAGPSPGLGPAPARFEGVCAGASAVDPGGGAATLV